MARLRADETTLKWIKTLRDRQIPPQAIAAELLRLCFSLSAVRGVFQNDTGLDWNALALLEADRDVDYQALAAVSLTQGGRDFPLQRVATDKVQLFVLDDFLSDAECDGLVALIDQNLQPTTIATAAETKGYRTNRTCDLGLSTAPLVRTVDEKIARALGIPLLYSERIQGQRYDTGEEYKQHADFFPPGPDGRKLMGAMGNRTWTFMIYLNDVEKGGGTGFPAIEKSFSPQKRRALVWNNLYADGTLNLDTRHAGLPVEAGSKVIVTKWFRERARPT